MLKNRFFLVTGATDGIGKHTAIKLAKNGANIIIHGRTMDKVQKTIEEINIMAHSNSQIHYFIADFSKLNDIYNMSVKIHEKFHKIDVLINNAGIFTDNKRFVTQDGFELTFQVNVLAPFLLTRLLLDLLKKGSNPRIINVASLSHWRGLLDINNLQFEKGGFSNHSAYELSKLCIVMFTIKLAEKLKFPVLTLDPGTVNTKMLLAGWGRCGIEIEQANDEYWVSTHESLNNITGKYYEHQQETIPNTQALDKNARNELWTILSKLTSISYDDV